MSEVREGKRQLHERIEALKRENADLFAQLTEAEAALVQRDAELSRATDQAPRPLLRYVLLPLLGMAAVFTFLYFFSATSAREAPEAPGPGACPSAAASAPAGER